MAKGNNNNDLLAKRRDNFEKFLAERMSVLAEFAKTLGFENPNYIVASPSAYLSDIDCFMKNQIITDDDKVWIKVRLGYYIGELFIEKFGGCWFINELPNTRFFLRYVVGKFTHFENQNIMFDPFEVIETYLNLPVGRSLENLILEIENEILSFNSAK